MASRSFFVFFYFFSTRGGGVRRLVEFSTNFFFFFNPSLRYTHRIYPIFTQIGDMGKHFIHGDHIRSNDISRDRSTIGPIIGLTMDAFNLERVTLLKGPYHLDKNFDI